MIIQLKNGDDVLNVDTELDTDMIERFEKSDSEDVDLEDTLEIPIEDFRDGYDG